MDCERFAGALTDFALGAPLETRAAAHLATCPMCAARLDTERRLVSSIDSGLQTALAVEPAPGFAARLESRLNDTRVDAHSSRWWVYAAAAATVLLVVGVTLVDRPAPPTVATSQPVRDIPLPASATPVVSMPPRQVLPPPSIARRRQPKPPPLVLVPPEQEEGLRQLLVLINAGRIDSTALLPAAEPVVPGVVPSIESSIVPITIEPLFPVPAGEKPGGSQ